jgi:hypothetical protein
MSHEDHGALAALRDPQQAQLDLWKDGSVQYDDSRIEVSYDAPRRLDDREILGERAASPTNLV